MHQHDRRCSRPCGVPCKKVYLLFDHYLRESPRSPRVTNQTYHNTLESLLVFATLFRTGKINRPVYVLGDTSTCQMVHIYLVVEMSDRGGGGGEGVTFLAFPEEAIAL